ncbi:MAG: hypothetical protein KKB25_00780 [Nanoarchaeota archaeon]|nr:hypothetical protein [Nanoarchaeota archaeon]
MPVAGINITSVNVKRIGSFAGEYQMNCNASIKDVKEQELPQSRKGLSVPAEFSAVYADEKGKSLAEITIIGDVLFLDEKNEQILKDWKDGKKIPESLTVQIMNVMMRDVLTRTIQLTDFLRLPIPLPTPSFVAAPQKMEKKK